MTIVLESFRMTDISRTVTALGLEEATSVPTPGVASHRAAMYDSPELDEAAASRYISCVGSLLFCMQDVPDGQLECSLCTRFLKSPTEGSEIALKRLVRYLAGTRERCIEMRIAEADKLQNACAACMCCR